MLSDRAPGEPTTTYYQTTPVQAVGSDFSAHIVTASVTGLVPNAVYNVELVATNPAGTTYGPNRVLHDADGSPAAAAGAG